MIELKLSPKEDPTHAQNYYLASDGKTIEKCKVDAIQVLSPTKRLVRAWIVVENEKKNKVENVEKGNNQEEYNGKINKKQINKKL